MKASEWSMKQIDLQEIADEQDGVDLFNSDTEMFAHNTKTGAIMRITGMTYERGGTLDTDPKVVYVTVEPM